MVAVVDEATNEFGSRNLRKPALADGAALNCGSAIKSKKYFGKEIISNVCHVMNLDAAVNGYSVCLCSSLELKSLWEP